MRPEGAFEIALVEPTHGVAGARSHGEGKARGYAEVAEPLVIIHYRWRWSFDDADEAHEIA